MIIGIDPGTKTGIAIWDEKKMELIDLKTTKLHRAWEMVKQYKEQDPDLIIRLEDARMRKWFGKTGREKLQGAGSVKRDCRAWEHFCEDYGIPLDLVPPARVYDNPAAVKKYWKKRSSVHAREAASMVLGLSAKQKRLIKATINVKKNNQKQK